MILMKCVANVAEKELLRPTASRIPVAVSIRYGSTVLYRAQLAEETDEK